MSNFSVARACRSANGMCNGADARQEHTFIPFISWNIIFARPLNTRDELKQTTLRWRLSLAISSPAVCSFAKRASVAKLQVQQEDVAQKLGEDMYNTETPPTFRLAGGSLTPAFQIWCFAVQKSFAETFSLVASRWEAQSDSNQGTPPEKMQKWSSTSAEEVLPHPSVAVPRVWCSAGSSWDQLEGDSKINSGEVGESMEDLTPDVHNWPLGSSRKTQNRNLTNPRSVKLHRLGPCTLAQFYLTIPATDWFCQCTKYLGISGVYWSQVALKWMKLPMPILSRVISQSLNQTGLWTQHCDSSNV